MAPLVSAEHLADAGPVRLVHVPNAGAAREGLVQVPIDTWIAHARTTETGLDDLGFWENAFRTLGIGIVAELGVEAGLPLTLLKLRPRARSRQCRVR